MPWCTKRSHGRRDQDVSFLSTMKSSRSAIAQEHRAAPREGKRPWLDRAGRFRYGATTAVNLVTAAPEPPLQISMPPNTSVRYQLDEMPCDAASVKNGFKSRPLTLFTSP